MTNRRMCVMFGVLLAGAGLLACERQPAEPARPTVVQRPEPAKPEAPRTDEKPAPPPVAPEAPKVEPESPRTTPARPRDTGPVERPVENPAPQPPPAPPPSAPPPQKEPLPPPQKDPAPPNDVSPPPSPAVPFRILWGISVRPEFASVLVPDEELFDMTRPVIILYSSSPPFVCGDWPPPPEFQDNPKNPRTPLDIDLGRHLEKVKTDLLRLVPPTTPQNAIMCLDYEWPNFGLTHATSYGDFKKVDPATYDRISAAVHAETAKVVRQQTGRKVCYWGYPPTDPVAVTAADRGVNDSTAARAVYASVDLLTPSLYPVRRLVDGAPGQWDATAAVEAARVKGMVEECRRIDPGKPVYPFICEQYGFAAGPHQYQLLHPKHLALIVRAAREAGAEGVIFWQFPGDRAHADRLASFLRMAKPLLIEATKGDEFYKGPR